MKKSKQISIFFIVSFVISIATTAVQADMALFSLEGILTVIITTAAMVGIPLGLCSIPAGVHWLIWHEWLNGIELSAWALWSMGCLTSILSIL
jgi:hypothetical protein